MKSFIDVGRRAAAASLAVSDNRSPRDRCARRLRARSAPRVGRAARTAGARRASFGRFAKALRDITRRRDAFGRLRRQNRPGAATKLQKIHVAGCTVRFGTNLCTDKLSWEQRFYRHRLQTCQRRRFTLPTTSLELGESSPLVVISHLVNLERVWRRRSLERIRVV